jgi:DNA repair exonuclease SbcCD ATPase subunit
MIPVRLRLEGFMSYRDEVVFEFSDATLWVLSGPNGSGKSAVFNALCFALYGEKPSTHVTGAELISHGCKQLLVELDFQSGGEMYRVRRIWKEKSKSSKREAFRLEVSADGETLDEVAIPRTDGDKGYQEWVKNAVGMDSTVFLSSVFLRQGKSDRILDATAEERYEILSQIINLAPYKELQKRVENARAKAFSDREAYRDQIKGIREVTDEEEAEARSRVAELKAQESAATEYVIKLAGWLENAGLYEEARKELQQQREAIQQLEERESEFERWIELRRVVSLARVAAQLNGRKAKRNDRIAASASQVGHEAVALAHTGHVGPVSARSEMYARGYGAVPAGAVIGVK